MAHIYSIKVIDYNYMDNDDPVAIVKYETGIKRVYTQNTIPKTAREWLMKNESIKRYVYKNNDITMETYMEVKR